MVQGPSALLIVLAHPDDECFGVGASAARYAKAGHRVALATLTRGGGGLWQGHQAGDSTPLTEVRRTELTRSAKVLGIDALHSLDYPDGSLHRLAPHPGRRGGLRAAAATLRRRRPEEADPEGTTPRTRLVAELVKVIQEVNPDAIVTFGPEGRDGHPDHVATHSLVRLAWRAAQTAERRARKLYYEVAPPPAVAELGLPAQPPVTAHVWVGDFQARKRRAFECHRSQAHERERVDLFIRAQGDWECFSLAGGRPGRLDETGFETDLLAAPIPTSGQRD